MKIISQRNHILLFHIAGKGPNESREGVATYILSEYYHDFMDWETLSSNADTELFRNILDLLKLQPSLEEISLDGKRVEVPHKDVYEVKVGPPTENDRLILTELIGSFDRMHRYNAEVIRQIVILATPYWNDAEDIDTTIRQIDRYLQEYFSSI